MHTLTTYIHVATKDMCDHILESRPYCHTGLFAPQQSIATSMTDNFQFTKVH